MEFAENRAQHTSILPTSFTLHPVLYIPTAWSKELAKSPRRRQSQTRVRAAPSRISIAQSSTIPRKKRNAYMMLSDTETSSLGFMKILFLPLLTIIPTRNKANQGREITLVILLVREKYVMNSFLVMFIAPIIWHSQKAPAQGRNTKRLLRPSCAK